MKTIDKKAYSMKIVNKNFHTKKIELQKRLLKKGESSVLMPSMIDTSNNLNN